MVAKGIIRIKCVDLANWAAREGIFSDASTEDTVRYATEGMDTVIVHVEKTDSLENLMAELHDAMTQSIEKFAQMSDTLSQLMRSTNAILAGGTDLIKQSFKMQLNDPGVSPYIEVVIKTTED